MTDWSDFFAGLPTDARMNAAVESLRGIVYAVLFINQETGEAMLLHGKDISAAHEFLGDGTADEKMRRYTQRYVPRVERQAVYERFCPDALRRADSAGIRRVEGVYPRIFENGHQFVSAAFSLMRNHSGELCAIAMFQNISELIALRMRAESDTLTGLLNRDAAQNRIQAALDNLNGEERGTFIFCDVDNLKRINDSYGHPCGDEALRRVAWAMQKTFRDSDVICRISGDEFVVWMPGVANAGLVERKIFEMKKLLSARRQGERAIPVSLSVGAAFACPGDTYQALYRITDEALYRAKDKGKGICVFVERDETGRVINRPQPVLAIDESRPLLLVVDDTAINRVMLSQVFEGMYFVLEAEDGQQALSLLTRYGERIDAVLLDMVMPGMDGAELLRIMQEKGMLTELPVIVVSADASEDAVARAFELGAADYVCKPFLPSLLRRRVRDARELSRQRRE